MSQQKKGEKESGAATSGSTKILAEIALLNEKIKEIAAAQANVDAEMIKMLNDIRSGISSGGTASRSNRGGGSKAGSSSNATGAKKKFDLNSLTWFKGLWKGNREEAIELVGFTKEQLANIDEHMNTDAKMKDLEGDAKQIAEITYLWATYIDKNASLRLTIKNEFEKRKKAFEAANKTPAEKEKNGEEGEDEHS